MSKTRKIKKALDFQKYLAKRLKEPKFKKYYNEHSEQLEIAYQVLKLRKKEGVSQAQLAKKLGTTQSNVARMESGQQNFTANTLQKIASALHYKLQIKLVK